MSTEVKYMHINPYAENGSLSKKVDELDQPHKDTFETIRDISLVMDYVDDVQMEALTQGNTVETRKSSGKENPQDRVRENLEDMFGDAMTGFDDLEKGLGDED